MNLFTLVGHQSARPGLWEDQTGQGAPDETYGLPTTDTGKAPSVVHSIAMSKVTFITGHSIA